MKLYSNEIVFRGHPDKTCDQISDALLDAYLSSDKYTRAGIEVAGGKGIIFVTGEVTSKANVDVESVVKRVITEIGLNANDYKVIDNIGKQSSDIAQGVDIGGAGDQGMMFGYACNDTPELLPKAMVILQKLSVEYDKLIRTDNRFYPDGKCQITGYYDDDFKLLKIKTFTMNYHNTEVEREETDKILKDIALSICDEYGVEVEEFLINPTGKFLIGSFEGDSGLTGRKIVVDAYQSFANVGGGAYCVDKDTEYLTLNGWKSVNEYTKGEKVGQWDRGKLEFVNPYAYIECNADKMYKFESPNSLNMVLSENHDMVLETSKGNIIKKQVREVLDENGQIKTGSNGSIPCYFEYNTENKGIKLTNQEIRLQVAFCADGTILKNNSNWLGRIRVKKGNKKEMLYKLFSDTCKEFKVTEHDDGFSIFYYNPDILNRSLKECFNECSNEQLKIIADEVFKWDGCAEKKIYRTTQKEDADFVQFILMSLTGKTVSIRVDDRIGEEYQGGYIRKSICYEVSITTNSKVGLRHGVNKKNHLRLEVTPFKTLDGRMYCFMVPSGMLVLRRDNKVFVTGNSGKDSTKVDRSAAYKARQIAKRMVKENDLNWCEVQLSYAIGKAKPLAIYIDSDKGNIEVSKDLYEACTPANIIKELGLQAPVYEETAKFGHYGNPEFSWEK